MSQLATLYDTFMRRGIYTNDQGFLNYFVYAGLLASAGVSYSVSIDGKASVAHFDSIGVVNERIKVENKLVARDTKLTNIDKRIYLLKRLQ